MTPEEAEEELAELGVIESWFRPGDSGLTLDDVLPAVAEWLGSIPPRTTH